MILTIGAFALFGRELSLIIVSAVLTIAGYSIKRHDRSFRSDSRGDAQERHALAAIDYESRD